VPFISVVDSDIETQETMAAPAFSTLNDPAAWTGELDLPFDDGD